MKINIDNGLYLYPLSLEELSLWLNNLTELENKLNCTYFAEPIEGLLKDSIQSQLILGMSDVSQNWVWYTYWFLIREADNKIIGFLSFKGCPAQDSGSIEIGGVNIKDLSLQEYNNRVAYVSQDNFLFDMSIRENIRLGKEGASDKEVEEVAKKSGCYDFIMSLENGFETIVGGSGTHLSGGERQRIAIARAMMKDAPIVILDEATAYTDPENEAIIQQSVGKLVAGKTLIVIAHRLSTVKDADKLYVIKGGVIDSEGTHQQLLEQGGLYKNMWEAHIESKDE